MGGIDWPYDNAYIKELITDATTVIDALTLMREQHPVALLPRPAFFDQLPVLFQPQT